MNNYNDPGMGYHGGAAVAEVPAEHHTADQHARARAAIIQSEEVMAPVVGDKIRQLIDEGKLPDGLAPLVEELMNVGYQQIVTGIETGDGLMLDAGLFQIVYSTAMVLTQGYTWEDIFFNEFKEEAGDEQD